MSLAAVAAVTALAAGAGAPTVELAAPGHSPKTGTRWAYTVTARTGGKPASARLTAQIVDPIGGVHAVAYGTTKKPLRNWPFTGTFHDFVIWPAETRGIPL